MPVLCSVSLWKRERSRVGESERMERLQRVCWCVCAQPVSLIGQMSCVHYKRWTLVRWEAVSPGISSVGQQSTRPPGRAFWLAYWKDGAHVSCGSCLCVTVMPAPVSLHSAASVLHLTSYRKLGKKQLNVVHLAWKNGTCRGIISQNVHK